MKVLFVTAKSPDHLSSCLWDGLQEVCGEENVFDAVGCPWLHKSSVEAMTEGPNERRLGGAGYLGIGAAREGRTFQKGDLGFELVVINSVFNRDHDWSWMRDWRWITAAHCKWAYIEGWDGSGQIHIPECHVDAVFRKEINPTTFYPYDCHQLGFAAPARWFHTWLDVDGPWSNRPIDVFFAGNPDSNHPHRPIRWEMMSRVFQTRRHHNAVIASCGLGTENWWNLLRTSKLALCPAAADGADSLRTYEAVACGAIPVFVGYPNHTREPWFPPETCFSCTVDTLPEHIDEALSHDLGERRRLLVEHARTHHTTRARAEKLLKVVFG